MDLQVVSHYGIHWSRDIAFLMQGRGGSNAIGLKEKAPFEVQLPNKTKHCNHQIPLANPVPNDYHWEYFLQLLEDPLTQAMLPVPKEDGGCHFVSDPKDDLMLILVMLSRMSSPIYPCVVPIWTITAEAAVAELQQINVQPFVLVKIEAKHATMAGQVAKAAVYHPRRLILAGRPDTVLPPVVKRIDTQLDKGKYDINDVMGLPWESLGAATVRKYMRKEWPLIAPPAALRPMGSSSQRAPRADTKRVP